MFLKLIITVLLTWSIIGMLLSLFDEVLSELPRALLAFIAAITFLVFITTLYLKIWEVI